MSDLISFRPAVRTTSKIKMAILGPSGSGKTFSALQIAQGFSGKIALLDTEAGSASLYSDKFNFDTVVLRPPFTPEKYIEVIKLAVSNGYDLLIIDSLTHAWDGEGGSLDQKSQLDARGGKQNEFANWKDVKAKQKKLTETINQSPIHIISTMRAKQEYQIVSSGGKTRPEKMGLGPIAMPGSEYEYTLVLEMAMNHEAAAVKDRTGLFDGRYFLPTPEIGKEIKNWLSSCPVADADEYEIIALNDYVGTKLSRINTDDLALIIDQYTNLHNTNPTVITDQMKADLKKIRASIKKREAQA